MKTITLEEAYKILENCSGVIVDDGAILYPSVWELNGKDENEFLYLSWEEEGLEFNVKFNEGSNREVKVSGCSMFLIEGDGEETQLTILVPQNLE